MIRYDGGRGGRRAHRRAGLYRISTRSGAVWTTAAARHDDRGAVTTSTAACPENRSVVLKTVDGGGHEWPAFATGGLWQFFVGHPRPSA